MNITTPTNQAQAPVHPFQTTTNRSAEGTQVVQALGAGLGLASSFARTIKGPGSGLLGVMSPAAGAIGNGGSLTSLEGLIERQIAVQSEMQVFSSRSNIEKTKHETRMTAIRNMRA